MNLFGRVHHLQAELILVQGDALDHPSIVSHDGDGFVFLRELFGRFAQPPGQSLAGNANRLDQGIHGSRGADCGQVGSEAPSLSFHHMTGRTVGLAIEQLFAMRRVAHGLCRRLHLYASQVGDDLPDLIVGHANALAVGSVGGHDRAGDSLADVLEDIRVGVSVMLVGAGQVRAAASAVRTEAVAKRAVNAELVFAGFCGFGVSGKWIAGLVGESGRS